jgi:hypothetical protein
MTNDPIAITEAELSAMTRDMDNMHHATMPKMREAIEEFRQTGVGRRSFLIGVGGVAAAIGIAACSSSSSSSRSSTPTTAAAPGQGLSGDLAIAALAAALENTAVATYQAGINAATANKLGAVPPAVVTFAQTAQSQHKQHAAAWNALLTNANQQAIPAAYGDLTVYSGVVTPAFAAVKDVVGLANLALTLETVAAETYLAAISAVSAPAAIKTAATIQPVEMQHAAILNFVLGNYPIPDSFAKTDMARPTTDKIGSLAAA